MSSQLDPDVAIPEPAERVDGALTPLIVNADDFGLTPGVCRGILRAHHAGVVTSTSALVVAPAFASYARALGDAGLPVGAHLALVGEDPPLLAASEIPTLVTRRGTFPRTWQQFVRRAATGAVDPADIRRELTAQLDLLGRSGLVVTHLDTHQNLHLWPQVATVVLALARERGIHAIRLTRTARWTPTSLGVRTLSAQLGRRALDAGLAFPGASAGLDEAGALDRTGFLRAIDYLGRCGATSAELVTHLAEDPDPDRARYASTYRWSDGLAAACDPDVRSAVERAGFRLASYADLGTPPDRPGLSRVP